MPAKRPQAPPEARVPVWCSHQRGDGLRSRTGDQQIEVDMMILTQLMTAINRGEYCAVVTRADGPPIAAAGARPCEVAPGRGPQPAFDGSRIWPHSPGTASDRHASYRR